MVDFLYHLKTQKSVSPSSLVLCFLKYRCLLLDEWIQKKNVIKELKWFIVPAVQTHKNTGSCCGSCGAESIFSVFIISLEKPGCELRLDWRKGSICDATARVSHRFNWRSCSIHNVTWRRLDATVEAPFLKLYLTFTLMSGFVISPAGVCCSD